MITYRVLEGLTSFYWALLPQFLAENLWNADWHGSRGRYGLIIGYALELVRSLLTLNVHGFRVHPGGGWSGRDIQKLLDKKRIPAYGWAWVDGFMYFHVPIRFAGWATHLMAKARVPLAE